MKITIKHILIAIGVVLAFAIGAFFVGKRMGKLSADESEINKKLAQTEKQLVEAQQDIVVKDAQIRKLFSDNGKQHTADSIYYTNLVKDYTAEFDAELKQLRRDKKNRNFRDLGIDSTIIVLSGFVPKKNN